MQTGEAMTGSAYTGAVTYTGVASVTRTAFRDGGQLSLAAQAGHRSASREATPPGADEQSAPTSISGVAASSTCATASSQCRREESRGATGAGARLRVAANLFHNKIDRFELR